MHSKVSSPEYDMVVIGAGIQGAAVAQAACAAGYSVLVLEQYAEPAIGTSSRSSKLIHGGLRYLESFDFKLVKESLDERALLLKNAPHLVSLKEFHIPVYKNTSRRPWKIMAGLALYSLFSGKKFSRIPKSKWGELDGLDTQNLQAVFSYFDAQTDDKLLTEAVLASSIELGAKVEFNATFNQCQINQHSCGVAYLKDGETVDITAECLVNASGPWVEAAVEKISPPMPTIDVDLVQGTHIEIPGNLKNGMYYLESPSDKRAVFVLPWKGHLMVGTTENMYTGDPAKVHPLDEEVDYLLGIYNHYFNQSIQRNEVINQFAGLRVLPAAAGKAFKRSREVEMLMDNESKPRVLSLYGGKLTVHRATAEQVMDKLAPTLPKRERRADSREVKLPRL